MIYVTASETLLSLLVYFNYLFLLTAVHLFRVIICSFCAVFTYSTVIFRGEAQAW